jgi:hypothetical protein
MWYVSMFLGLGHEGFFSSLLSPFLIGEFHSFFLKDFFFHGVPINIISVCVVLDDFMTVLSFNDSFSPRDLCVCTSIVLLGADVQGCYMLP